MKKILVINPGSTSTKLAVYEDDKQVWRESIYHSTEDLAHFHHINEQYEYRRTHTLEALEKSNLFKIRCCHCSRGNVEAYAGGCISY